MLSYTPIPAPLRTPSLILLEETNPERRLDAHLELGRRAIGRADTEAAQVHFEAAFEIDPTDERPRAELRGLGQPKTRRGFFDFLQRTRNVFSLGRPASHGEAS